MKILMVTNNMRIDSGVSSSIASLGNELVNQGHEVYVASLVGKGLMSARLDIPESHIIDLSKKNNLITKAFALHRFIKKIKIDVVHTHMHRPGVVGRLAAIGTKSATIVTEHSTYFPANKWRYGINENMIDSFLARRTDCLVAVSPSVAATFASRITVLPNTIKVIYNAVDRKRFNTTLPKNLNGIDDCIKNILFIGRFAYEKNADLSIKILKLLKQRGVSVKLTIAGSGTLKDDIVKLIKAEQLENDIELVGAVVDIPLLMRKMDALLLTSYWEGCPMSIIEAYASELPVVATNVSGVIDIVDNHRTGILIDPEDPSQDADKVAELLTDKNLSRTLTTNALEKLKLFSPERIAAQYIECYKYAVEKKYRRENLKIISLNIEGGKYLDNQISFFKKENPDIVCLQEVCESDFHKLKDRLGMDGRFTPTWVRVSEGVQGIAILSKVHIETSSIISFGDDEVLDNEEKTIRSCMVVTIQSKNTDFVIGNIHFTWSPDGKPTDLQRMHMNSLLKKLKKIPDIILCGDFNAPRGGELFDMLGKKYTDNIPLHYTSTIDPKLHRVRGLELVVDGLFSTDTYNITNVRLVLGVSDHCAVVAFIR